MNEWILPVVIVLVVLVMVGLFVVLLLREKKKVDECGKINYKAFFILGMNFIPIGVVFMIVVSPAFISFLAIGLCYIAIGMSHKDEWDKENV